MALIDANKNYVPTMVAPAPGDQDAQTSALTQEVFTGDGSPEGVVTAAPGKIYNQISGGVMIAQWTKLTGTGSTGWGGG